MRLFTALHFKFVKTQIQLPIGCTPYTEAIVADHFVSQTRRISSATICREWNRSITVQPNSFIKHRPFILSWNFYDFTASDKILFRFQLSSGRNCRLFANAGRNNRVFFITKMKSGSQKHPVLGFKGKRISNCFHFHWKSFTEMSVSKIGLYFIQSFELTLAQARKHRKHRNLNFRWMRNTICGLCPWVAENRVSFMTKNYCRHFVESNSNCVLLEFPFSFPSTLIFAFEAAQRCLIKMKVKLTCRASEISQHFQANATF